MIGARVIIKRGSKEEAEKPFWISFSDLMSALMVLFLVVMSVALLAVTKKVSDEELARIVRDREINAFLREIRDASIDYPEIAIDFDRKSISFGALAQFDDESSILTDRQAAELRKYVPSVILPKANSELGSKWLRRIVVEGFTSRTGDYLYNLNLSLARSQRVLCVLLEERTSTEDQLITPAQRAQIRDLFFVGGYSFNLAKASEEESRRFEMRLEFLAKPSDGSTPVGQTLGNFGKCLI